MPCWYFEKKELQSTPSIRDGISADTEAVYRREGARFIIDAGTKMGLRYDTCATGVVYFHRFYLFHSFKEFHRYVTAACCLFLAGKVEETPKKCKDLIKVTRSMLTDEHFNSFGQDPREEVMTLERILLQTIKFDLMVEHPYAFVLKFAKLVKGDKAKIQKMVQMAWTFVNDSLCTMLCLQWEPEVIAVALMYLTSRLNKFDITDWQGKPSGYRGKWFEFLVEDVTLELLEDICHQVLDLYSKPQPAARSAESAAASASQPSSTEDQSRTTPRTPKSPQVVKRPAPIASSAAASSAAHPMDTSTQPPSHTQHESPSVRPATISAPGGGHIPPARPTPVLAPAAVPPPKPSSSYSQTNPYIATQMYASSFMSQEGSQSIQSLMGGREGRDEGVGGSLQPPVGRAPVPPQQVYQQGPPTAFQAPPSTAIPPPSTYSQQPPLAQSGYHHPPAGGASVSQGPPGVGPYPHQYIYTGAANAQYLPQLQQQQLGGAGYNQNYPMQTISNQSYGSGGGVYAQYGGDGRAQGGPQRAQDHSQRHGEPMDRGAGGARMPPRQQWH